MNYYKRHIGDYSTKAGHLSMLEHGAYNVLIDRYYNGEQAPTRAEALRWTRAKSADEIAAVDAVLAEFFTEQDGRFTQSRIEEELAAFRVKQEANRLLGSKGGVANAERIAKRNASETHSEPEAKREAEPRPSHKPLATSHEEAKATPRKTAGAVSPEAVVDAYHEALPGCARVVVLSPKRKRQIQGAEKMARGICRDRGWDYGPEFWQVFFAECAKDPWMRGEVPHASNPAWKQSLDVLLRDDHFAKVMDRALGGDA